MTKILNEILLLFFMSVREKYAANIFGSLNTWDNEICQKNCMLMQLSLIRRNKKGIRFGNSLHISRICCDSMRLDTLGVIIILNLKGLKV